MAFQLPPPPVGEDIKSPSWRDWFFKIQQYVSNLGALFTDLDFTGSNITSIATRNHNDLQNIQGGTTSEYYHLTSAQHTDLTDSGDSTSHYHATDRNSANFTGTNWTDLTDAGDSSLHYHAADRARANHTGTQSWATLSSTPTTLSGYGITDAQPLDADLTAITGLTGTGFVKLTGGGTWSIDSGGGGGGNIVYNVMSTASALDEGIATSYPDNLYINSDLTLSGTGKAVVFVSGAVVELPAAGTLTGDTLASNVVHHSLLGSELTGTSLASNITTSSLTSVATGAISSGVYTPTLANINNAGLGNSYQAHYTRIGDIVQVAGQLEASPIAGAGTTFHLSISLPIASSFPAVTRDCSGLCSTGLADDFTGIIYANGTNAKMSVYAAHASTRTYIYTFSYRVL